MIGASVIAALLAAQVGTISPGAIQSIGPKQDDPRALCASDPGVKSPERGIVVQGGIIVQGGLTPQTGPEQIGPKQDDPRSPAQARPGDDNDPKASGGSTGRGPIVRRNILAIGPKQDDPRSPSGSVARPGDDEDPQALCLPGRG